MPISVIDPRLRAGRNSTRITPERMMSVIDSTLRAGRPMPDILKRAFAEGGMSMKR